MSASWLGLILLGTATSLPELITGVSTVTIANAPDILVGDVLGSTLFNLVILVYITAMRSVHRYEQRTLYTYTEGSTEPYPQVTLRQAIKGYTLAAFGIVVIWKK